MSEFGLNRPRHQLNHLSWIGEVMKKVFKSLMPILATVIPTLTCASPQTLVNRPAGQPKGLVIIAPAKKYLMQERLFEGLAQSLSRQGLIVVRFNWDIQTLSEPALELQRAAVDIKSVITEAQKYFKASPQNTVLISKSFSTKAITPSLSLAKSHVLLTPNCSTEAPFQSIYGQILENKNFRTSIFISNEDPNCDVKQIHQAMIQLKNPPVLHISHGDHNFVLQPSPQTLNPSSNSYRYQDATIQMVTTQVLTDLF